MPLAYITCCTVFQPQIFTRTDGLINPSNALFRTRLKSINESFINYFVKSIDLAAIFKCKHGQTDPLIDTLSHCLIYCSQRNTIRFIHTVHRNKGRIKPNETKTTNGPFSVISTPIALNRRLILKRSPRFTKCISSPDIRPQNSATTSQLLMQTF